MGKTIIARYISLTVLLLLLSWGTVAGDNVFHQYANTENAFDNTTLCALRDRYGFLWVGTSTGLNCYDGNGASVYSTTGGMLHFAETSNVNMLYEYGEDILFCGNSGLNLFRRKSNVVVPFPYKTKYGVCISSTVQKIVKAGNGTLWICTHGQGLFVFDPAKGTLRQDSRHGIFFSDMVVGRDGLIYTVSLSGQVAVFRPGGQLVYSCPLPEYVADKNRIGMVSLGSDIWLSLNTKLYRLDTRTRTVTCKSAHAVPAAINCLYPGDDGRSLFLGTADGIWQYAVTTGATTRLDPPQSYAYGLTDRYVNYLCRDADGSLIVVTTTGISYMPYQSDAFSFIGLPPAMRSESCNYVRALCPSINRKSVWVGTDHGLASYTIATGEMRAVPLKGDNDEITSITADGKFLWIGLRHSGLRLLDISTGAVKSYTYDANKPYSVISNDINGVYRTSRGEIFVLTNWGLCRFNPATEQFMTFSNLSQQTACVSMLEDSRGRLWLGTKNQGLFMRERENAIFNYIPVPNVSNSPVTAMSLDGSGNLWVAVQGAGVYRYDDAEGNFVQLDVAALWGKTVIFMEEDEQGNMWIGLHDIIVRIGKTGGSRLYTYNTNANFLPIMWSSCRLADGRLLFGSGNGFFAFKTDRMRSIDRLLNVYPLYLSFPYRDNSDAELDRLGLNLLLYTQKEIRLPYADNTFTIHLSASRYADMPAMRYDYMMSGVDKNWIRGATVPEITYSNLSPGEYEFLLRCSGDSNAKVSVLHIVVLPPWYRTVWAWMVYIVLAALAAWYVFLRSRRIIRRRYETRMQEYKVRKEGEMYRSKIQFFVDLVHEIRTPLTLMSLPMERMSEQLAEGQPLPVDESREHIASMRRNMDYLLSVTNELLDFQKAEYNGKVNLCRRNCSLNTLLRDICLQFEHSLAVEGKKFTYRLPDTDITTSLDVEKIKRVLVNLIGNAMKYARHEVTVTVRNINEVSFTIAVGDDGPGVPDEERRNIFNMYYQIGNDTIGSSLGTGLGLAYAKMLATAHGGDLTVGDNEGGGALFMLTLPIVSSKTEAEEKPAIADVAAETSDETSVSPAETHNFCVLLVEDNKELLRAEAEALDKWYKVMKACDGVEALDVMQYNDIDLIITDVMMPRMDGVELCRRVKNDINYSHIPVIMLTARTTSEAKVEGMENGADIYIEKPFTIKQLHLQIVNLLRMRNLFHERMQSINGMEKPEVSAGELGMNRHDINFLHDMNKYMMENIGDDEFSIDMLAEKMNMSRSSFYRKIKALTGMTPVDFMRNARLDHAAKLLAAGERATAVGMMVGFTSSSYFAKCFKAKFGVLPKDYVSSNGK